jgi:hypothetical protein
MSNRKTDKDSEWGNDGEKEIERQKEKWRSFPSLPRRSSPEQRSTNLPSAAILMSR